MKLLLDTHIYLWWLEDSPMLSASARKMIVTAEKVYISSASLWESAIKTGIGKLDVNQEELVAGIVESGFTELPVRAEHTVALLRLENHHKDPFDRMLIAQALSEPLHLLTADSILTRYSALVISI
ncbi:MAG: type II toxin-antitoxin system VapC family toxin [Desulfuromonadales bacterium]